MICLFIEMPKRMQKYSTKIGQNTGTLNAWKNVALKTGKSFITSDSKRQSASNKHGH